MKKPFAVYFSSVKAVLFLALLLSLFIYSCRKDIVNLGIDSSKPADITVSSAKTWYETKYIGKSSAQLTYNIQNADNSFDLSKYFNPSWAQAINYTRYNDDVLEMPVDEASKIGILIGSDQKTETNSRSSVLIIKRNGTYQACIMTIVGTNEYVKGDISKLAKNSYANRAPDFSGLLYYSTPQGKFLGGYIYSHGNITNRLTKNISSSVSSQVVQSTGKQINTAQMCTSWYYYTQYTNSDGTLSTPEYHYGGQDCYDIPFDTGVPGIPTTGGGGSSGSGGGGSGNPGVVTPTEPNPCKVEGPVAVSGTKIANSLQTQKLPDDGGFPPVPEEPCPPVEAVTLIIDASKLKNNFPCAVKLILDKLSQNPNFNNFILPFATEKKPDLNWDSSSLSWNSPDPMLPGSSNTYKLGQTQASGRSATITLNSNMLQNSSQLMIAGAIIHESIHAYINYNIQTYVGGFQVPADYNSGKFWLYSLNVWSTLDGLPGNYRDHSEMLSGYFGQAVSALKAWDNGVHTDKEYAMIMLYGLDTGDLPPSQASLTSAFSTIMSTYGITNANLQSFWSSQLNSTTNKLPTGGC